MAEINLAVKKLQEKFPASVLEVKTFRDEINVTIQKKDIFEICKFLYSDPDLQYLCSNYGCRARHCGRFSPAFSRLHSEGSS